MTFKILAIDGGGIRGILAARLLVQLEQIIGGKIGDAFDLIAGTSTGALLACGLLVPKSDNSGTANYSAQQLLDMYIDHGATIFPPEKFTSLPFRSYLSSSLYPDSGILSVLDRYFGGASMGDLLKPCLIPSYDVVARKAKFFRREPSFLVKDVLRATTSAPTYFNPAQITSLAGEKLTLIDGGIVANNPAMCAWAEAVSKHNATPSDIRLLSIGCGNHAKSYSYTDLTGFFGFVAWVKPIIDFLFDGSSQTVDFQLRQIFDEPCGRASNDPHKSPNSPHYTRADLILGHLSDDPNLDLDDASKPNIDKLLSKGVKYANSQESSLRRFAAVMNSST